MDDGAGSYCVFIGGSPRSGTTLMQRIMGAHPDVFAGPEFDFVPLIMQTLQGTMRESIRSGRIDQIVDDETLQKAIRAFFDTIIRERLCRNEKRVFSEKTPANALELDSIVETFPDARCIMMVRNPSDIINSMKAVAKRYSAHGKPPRELSNVRRAMRVMNNHLQAGLKSAAKSDQIMIVFYEDLVQDTENTVRQVCDHVGLTFRREMLNIENGGFVTAELKNDVFYSASQLAGPISANRLVSKTFDLTALEVAIVEELIIPDAAFDRYELSANKNRWQNRLVRALYKIHSGFLDPLGKWS